MPSFTEEHIQQGRTTQEEAQHNEKTDHAAEEGSMLHSGESRGLMNHYRGILATYQHLVASIRGRMLLIVKTVMSMMKEDEPEELLNQREEAGYTNFEGLEKPRCGGS